MLAVIVLALFLFGGGGSYRVSMLLETSSQLVTGNEVKVGGVPIGTITSIDLTEDYQARVEVEIKNEDIRAVPRGHPRRRCCSTGRRALPPATSRLRRVRRARRRSTMAASCPPTRRRPRWTPTKS